MCSHIISGRLTQVNYSEKDVLLGVKVRSCNTFGL